MNRHMDWEAISKTVTRAYHSAPITNSKMDNASWVRWFNFSGSLKFTVDELAAFEAGNDRDSGYVDQLDYDTDLSRDPEWERS